MWGSKKQKKKVYSGFLGDCSPEQLEVLEKFKAFVQNLQKDHQKSKWDEEYLLRFLRARKFNLQDTSKMWMNFIEWRFKNDVKNSIYYIFPELPKLRKQYPHGYHKVDKKFRPIYIERVGLLNPQEIFKFSSPQRLLKYYAMSYQNLIDKILPACNQLYQNTTKKEDRVQQTCVILDLKDVRLTSAGKAYNFVKPASQLSQNNYPEILGKYNSIYIHSMFIINAPFLFTGIWTVIKMWIDEKTKEKIKILGSNFKKQLFQYIDPENLPSFIEGGKCTCQGRDCLSLNIGPWNPKGEQIYPYSVGIKHRNQQLKEQEVRRQKEYKQQIEKQLQDQKEKQREKEVRQLQIKIDETAKSQQLVTKLMKVELKQETKEQQMYQKEQKKEEKIEIKKQNQNAQKQVKVEQKVIQANNKQTQQIIQSKETLQ